jgi:DNA helicase HerA-like ATPase
MPTPLPIAKNQEVELALLSNLANRHGCITGATGTGKTVTLQAMAQALSNAGVPVFMADVKGDLSGLAKPGSATVRISQRFDMLGLAPPAWAGCPVTFWDVFGEKGHPVRATVSDLGPLLLSRMLNLNDIQQGVLQLVFRIADDSGLLLLDLKDLRAMLQHPGAHASEFQAAYGNISAASIGAIQRGLIAIEEQGVGVFFVTQNPLDIPDTVLGQLGNRVQHALRAYTPRDQKAVQAAAETFRPNPGLDTARAIGELEVGEALVSFRDEKGRPGMVERAYIIPPASQVAPITDAERAARIANSLVAGVLGGARSSRRKDTVEAIVKSAARTIGSQLGREIIRGVLGSILKR